MPQTDTGTLDLLLRLWAMYHGNPLFWIVLIVLGVPFILWWWNFLRRQWVSSGLVELLTNLSSYVTNRLSREQQVEHVTVTPSPRSGSPFRLWKELTLWPVLIAPLPLLLVIMAKEPLSARWWILVVVLAFSLLLLGTPIYVVVLVNYFRITRMVKKAMRAMVQSDIGDNSETTINHVDVFLLLAEDLRMGLDPRVVQVVFRHKWRKIDGPSILREFTQLNLIKPDRKLKQGQLARRYYLTRVGATLAVKIQKQRPEV